MSQGFVVMHPAKNNAVSQVLDNMLREDIYTHARHTAGAIASLLLRSSLKLVMSAFALFWLSLLLSSFFGPCRAAMHLCPRDSRMLECCLLSYSLGQPMLPCKGKGARAHRQSIIINQSLLLSRVSRGATAS